MKFIIELQKKSWKIFKKNKVTIYFNGYLNSESLEANIYEIFKNAFFVQKLKSIFRKLDGHFSIIIFSNQKVIFSVDCARTIPLIYYIKKNKVIIADNLEGIKRNTKEFLTIDKIQSKCLAMTGYTFGKGSLYKEIKSLNYGEFCYIDKFKCTEISYYNWKPFIKKYNSYEAEKKKLKDINHIIIEKLISSLNKKTAVIPLSAGLDSRLILSGLKTKKYKDIIAFSYGRLRNREVKTAKSLAEYLNIPWYYIQYNNLLQKKTLLSKSYIKYKSYADTATSVHFPQDFLAIQTLKQKKLIPDKSVIINGQTGDFISGNHLFNNSKSLSIKKIFDFYYNKHFKLWKNLQDSNKNTIFKIFKDRVEKNLNLSTSKNLQEVFQKVEFEDRQSKYVINGQRLYEYFGYEWRLPLWDIMYMNFWEKVDIDFKYDQKLYKETLVEQNWANVWKNIPINPRSQFSYQLELIRFFFKIIFFPVGKNKWHKFEKKYLEYFMSLLCGYANWSYLKIIRDNRGFSSPLSWHVEEYLNNKKINWNGEETINE